MINIDIAVDMHYIIKMAVSAVAGFCALISLLKAIWSSAGCHGTNFTWKVSVMFYQSGHHTCGGSEAPYISLILGSVAAKLRVNFFVIAWIHCHIMAVTNWIMCSRFQMKSRISFSDCIWELPISRVHYMFLFFFETSSLYRYVFSLRILLLQGSNHLGPNWHQCWGHSRYGYFACSIKDGQGKWTQEIDLNMDMGNWTCAGRTYIGRGLMDLDVDRTLRKRRGQRRLWYRILDINLKSRSRRPN